MHRSLLVNQSQPACGQVQSGPLLSSAAAYLSCCTALLLRMQPRDKRAPPHAQPSHMEALLAHDVAHAVMCRHSSPTYKSKDSHAGESAQDKQVDALPSG